MAQPSSPFESDYLLGLIALSVLCLLILAGLWRYSGSILPSIDGASNGETLVIWLIWAILTGVPVATGLFWLLIARQTRKD